MSASSVQRWRRLGHVYNVGGIEPWMASHASYPTPLVLPDGGLRVYFSPRDRENRSCITALRLALDDDQFAIVSGPEQPLLSPGKRGAFDDGGVTIGCVVPEGDQLLAYYVGWSLSVAVPFRNFIGLAVGPRDGTELRRYSELPILDRSTIDPYSLSYPWVLREEGRWRMWYGSHLCWGPEWLSMWHVIKEAQSFDGFQWCRNGRVAIPLTGDVEFAVSRPCVLRDADRYCMWYARRTPEYSLGYAESQDGEIWLRFDQAIALIGPAGDWESETMEYATVFDFGNRRYMLYNGNGFGRTGFGLAILER